METHTTVAAEAAPKRGRGRPRIHANDAARVAAYRERHGVQQLNVEINAELAEALDEYMRRHQMDGAGMTKSQVIEKLIRTQLLRKR